MEFRIADTFTDSLGAPDRRRAEGRQDDGLRLAAQPAKTRHEFPSNWNGRRTRTSGPCASAVTSG
jgi:hypothetical protein